jgi:hypothetical protein
MSAKGHLLLHVIPETNIFQRDCKRNRGCDECIEQRRLLSSWSSFWIIICIIITCCYLSASLMDISGFQIPVFSTSYIFKCFRNRRTLHTALTCDVYWTDCVCGSWFCFTWRLILEWRRYSGFCDTVSVVLSVAVFIWIWFMPHFLMVILFLTPLS